ncbi:MAG: hypothetical protein KY434_00225 [Actinobacteria bacterium]|nr:hypothetical protein [Actinomycetota bacterium]
MSGQENTRHAVRCYEAMLLTSLQLERDRQELQRALARDVDYARYARETRGVATKLETEPIGRL